MGNCMPPEPALSDEELAKELPLAKWYDNPRMKELRESGDNEVELLDLLILARKHVKEVRKTVRRVFIVWFQEGETDRTKEIREDILVYLVLAPDFTLKRGRRQVFDRNRRIHVKILKYFEDELDKILEWRERESHDVPPPGSVGSSRMITGLAFGNFSQIKLGKGLKWDFE